jgi:hypothetical protein
VALGIAAERAQSRSESVRFLRLTQAPRDDLGPSEPSLRHAGDAGWRVDSALGSIGFNVRTDIVMLRLAALTTGADQLVSLVIQAICCLLSDGRPQRGVVRHRHLPDEQHHQHPGLDHRSFFHCSTSPA